MSAPTTPLPSFKSLDDRDDERSVLLGYLRWHRVVLTRKLEGLTDREARLAACPPSGMSILGLVRHMTDVERAWFRVSLRGEEIGFRYTDGPGDERDLFPPDGVSATDTLAAFWDEAAVVDAILATASMDERTVAGHQHSTLRRIIVHLIEEYARHCGHADLLREAIDGRTGD
ncbi:MAG: DinB family protein [Desertimonas sp.]